MYLKNKQKLKEILWRADFDNILIWNNGDWDLYAGSYGEEIDGDDPVYIIKNRDVSGDIEHIDEFDELLGEIEAKLK